VLGHPHRALVHFGSGRYAYCKVSGRPDPVAGPAHDPEGLRRLT
jgi:hypothetical protein